MPSFDVVSEIDFSEVKNAVQQARKELMNRFDFRGAEWEITEEKNTLVLRADSDFRLQALTDVVLDKLTRRGVSPKNVERGKPEISSVGRARQVLTLKEGIDAEPAKKITGAVKASKLKLQAAIEGKKVRITGKKKDDLQSIMDTLRNMDLPVALSFENFRD